MTQNETLKELLEIVEHAISAGDWKVNGACDPEMIINCAKKALALSEKQHTFPDKKQPTQGEIVVTKNDVGQIVMVSRQDSEGNILSVIAESENT